MPTSSERPQMYRRLRHDEAAVMRAQSRSAPPVVTPIPFNLPAHFQTPPRPAPPASPQPPRNASGANAGLRPLLLTDRTVGTLCWIRSTPGPLPHTREGTHTQPRQIRSRGRFPVRPPEGQPRAAPDLPGRILARWRSRSGSHLAGPYRTSADVMRDATCLQRTHSEGPPRMRIRDSDIPPVPPLPSDIDHTERNDTVFMDREQQNERQGPKLSAQEIGSLGYRGGLVVTNPDPESPVEEDSASASVRQVMEGREDKGETVGVGRKGKEKYAGTNDLTEQDAKASRTVNREPERKQRRGQEPPAATVDRRTNFEHNTNPRHENLPELADTCVESLKRLNLGYASYAPFNPYELQKRRQELPPKAHFPTTDGVEPNSLRPQGSYAYNMAHVPQPYASRTLPNPRPSVRVPDSVHPPLQSNKRHHNVAQLGRDQQTPVANMSKARAQRQPSPEEHLLPSPLRMQQRQTSRSSGTVSNAGAVRTQASHPARLVHGQQQSLPTVARQPAFQANTAACQPGHAEILIDRRDTDFSRWTHRSSGSHSQVRRDGPSLMVLRAGDAARHRRGSGRGREGLAARVRKDDEDVGREGGDEEWVSRRFEWAELGGDEGAGYGEAM